MIDIKFMESFVSRLAGDRKHSLKFLENTLIKYTLNLQHYKQTKRFLS